MERRLAEARHIVAQFDTPAERLAGLLYSFLLYQAVDRGPDDVPAVLGLVTEAATWLAQRSSAQWQHPIEKLHRGIDRDTARGEVWVVEDDAGTAIATITITTTQTPSSGPRRPPRRRLYARRMVVTRAHAGQEIASALLAWAAQRVSTAGKRWLRLDAWSGNAELRK